MTNDFTISEILNDLKTLNYGDNQDKKEIKTKYNIDSNKKGDIEKALYEIANEIRKSETNITDEHKKVFVHTHSFGTKKGALEAFKDESEEFIKAMIEDRKNLCKKYGNSMIGKSYFREMENIEAALHYKKNEKNIEKTENCLKEVFGKLNTLTQDFRNMHLDKVIENAEGRFNNYKDLNYDELDRGYKIGYNEVKLHSDDFKSLDKYLEHSINEFNQIFDSNLNSVAERLTRNGLDNIDINIKGIYFDPKFLEMVIESKGKTYHCRSILAAEHSSLVQTHWRFIVTCK